MIKLNKNVPQISHVDFSQRAIEKAVTKQIIQKPLTMYSLFGGGGGLLFSWITAPVLPGLAGVLSSASLATMLIGAGAWGVNYLFRRKRIAAQHIQYLHQMMAQKRHEDIESLKTQLSQYLNTPGAEEYADQAIEQFERIKNRAVDFSGLLQHKLNRNELTFSRYLGAVEQVSLSIIDNIRRIVTMLQSVSHIDEAYIVERLNKLNALPDKKAADVEEENTLKQRFDLRRYQLDKINELLTCNEKAMTEFDILTVAVSEMETGSQFATTDLETSISDLQQLAQRAKSYS